MGINTAGVAVGISADLTSQEGVNKAVAASHSAATIMLACFIVFPRAERTCSG